MILKKVTAEVDQQEATPEPCKRPVPLTKGSDEGYNALLPWLAMGYVPIKSGTAKRSGIPALCRSFKDARDAMTVDGEDIKKHVTQGQIHRMYGK